MGTIRTPWTGVSNAASWKRTENCRISKLFKGTAEQSWCGRRLTILALRKWRQEDYSKFEASLGYTVPGQVE